MPTDPTSKTKTKMQRGRDLGVSMAAAITFTWLLEQTGITVPGEITAALATLFGFAGSFLSDYLPDRNSGPPSGGAAAAVCAGTGLALLVGCATTADPDTPRERLAVVDSQFGALVHTAADLRDQGVLTPQQAEQLDEPIQQANRALDMAWTAIENDRPDRVLEYTKVAQQLLPEIRAALQAAQSEENNDDGS